MRADREQAGEPGEELIPGATPAQFLSQRGPSKSRDDPQDTRGPCCPCRSAPAGAIQGEGSTEEQQEASELRAVTKQC